MKWLCGFMPTLIAFAFPSTSVPHSQFVFARSAPAGAPLGQVHYVLHHLTVKPRGGHMSAASAGTNVFTQEGAQTATNDKGSFRFQDETTLHMNENTHLMFRSPSETYVSSGEIAEYLTPGTNHRIVTAAAVASAIGTTFNAEQSADDWTYTVREGALQVSNKFGTVVVETNQQSTAGPDHAPTPPKPANVPTVFSWTKGIPTPSLPENVGLAANGGRVVQFSSQASGAGGPWDATNIDDGRLSRAWETADGAVSNQLVKIGFNHTGTVHVSAVVIDPAPTGRDPTSEDLKDFEIRVSTTGLSDRDFVTLFRGSCTRQGNLQRFKLPAIAAARYVELFAIDNFGSTDRLAVAELEIIAG